MPDEAPDQLSILKDYRRLNLDDQFDFKCGVEMDCFTCCCKDVSIVLTPYDVLRLKRALGVESGEFLDKYTISPFSKEQKIPVILLKMDKDSKRCVFVNEEGCSVYTNRPWACRMYPLGIADPENPNPEEHRFHFLMKEDLCHGHENGKLITVRDWIDDQGIEEYDMMGQSFKDLMVHPGWDQIETLTPQQMDMYYMACYDLDRFRRFVFETKFLQMFEVDEARVESMKKKDVELIEFAMHWLRFTLFKEKTMKIKRTVVEAWQAATKDQGVSTAGPDTMNERLANSNG